MPNASVADLPAARLQFTDPYAGMNKAERAVAFALEAELRRGDIAAWWYEAFTFKLAHDTRYTPDFIVQKIDGALEAIEVKGFMRDDAHVKLKLFAAMFPFRVTLIQKGKTIDYTSPRRRTTEVSR